MRDPILLEVNDGSAAGEVRRIALRLATQFEFGEDDNSRLGLIATELATNLDKHATGGLLLIGAAETSQETIEILALDSGPGIADVAEALRDGHSTTGTAGTGLGAISRLADFFQLHSQSQGTAILARIAKRGSHAADASAQLGSVSIPVRGERVNGDGWIWSDDGDARTVMVVDGLGHGSPAHEATAAALEAFPRASGTPAQKMRSIHEAMQHTRGAAVALAELNPTAGVLRFAGVGNISATIIDATARRSAVSLHGIVGHLMRDVREFTYPWSRESCLIMHSDGLNTRWDLDRYPALQLRDPALIAGVLWKDHRRHNDDATVVVVRTP